MRETKSRWCWQRDLASFRGLTDQDRSGFLIVLEWFENFRLRHELSADRQAVRSFWRLQVLREGVARGPWRLTQWESALRWYLNWLLACREAGADPRSLPERMRVAVFSAGSPDRLRGVGR